MISFADIQKRVVEELDIADLSPEDQERVVDELGGMLYKRMLMSIFDKIPENEHGRLKQLIDSGMDSEITELVHKHIPDVGAVIAQEFETSMQDYRAALLQSSS